MGAELAVLLLLAAYNPSPLEVHAGLTSEARKGP
jgi:hypothetical protein